MTYFHFLVYFSMSVPLREKSMNHDENVWRDIWNSMKKMRYEWMIIGSFLLYGGAGIGILWLIQYMEFPIWIAHVMIVLFVIGYPILDIVLHIYIPPTEDDG